VFIADDTLVNNITLGLPQDHVDTIRLADALATSQLTEFVSTLPQGLATPLGERGARLSGGQAQRVGIARALYLNRPLLVLDEATAALDPQLEEQVMEGLRRGRPRLAILVISHRNSTLMHCDRILRLDQALLLPELAGHARLSETIP
jgi:ABC-type multidrug transport system fused ATPase/permease subunit